MSKTGSGKGEPALMSILLDGVLLNEGDDSSGDSKMVVSKAEPPVAVLNSLGWVIV